MEAEIILSYDNEREAEAIAKAISPDNVRVPPGLFIQTVRRDTRVFTFIRCEKRLQTFISTIDDLLACVTTAERALLVAKDVE